MILSKQVAVRINVVSCKLTQYTAAQLRKQGIDLTPEQFLLVDLLWNQGPMTQQKIADAMQKDKNSVTKLINTLVRKGLVLRQQSLKDRRANIISPTEKGEDLKDSAKKKGIEILNNILEGIDENELLAFLDTLDKMSENMSKKPEK